MANAQTTSTIPSIEDFESEARSPRGWVKSFIKELQPNAVTKAPYNKKSTGIMLKQEASAQGKPIQTLERDGNLYVLHKTGEAQAQTEQPSNGKAAATPRTTMPTPSV